MQIPGRSIIANIWLVCVFSLGVLAAPAATHYLVPANTAAANPYTSWETAGTSVIDVVKAAMTNATVPRIVLVSNGVYVLTNTVVITNDVILRGINGRDVTVFNGNALYNFDLRHTNCVFDGLTITNGRAPADNGGGGIQLRDGTVSNCIIVGCVNANTVSGNYSGGGIQITGNGSVVNCIIRGNIATNTGGYGGGLNLRAGSKSIIRNCIIEQNKAYRGYGGGIYVESSAVIENCLIVNNVLLTNEVYSTAYGGGLHIGATDVFIANCTIVSNYASHGGSGLSMAKIGPLATNMVINCIIVSNRSNSPRDVDNILDLWRSNASNKYAIGYSCSTKNDSFILDSRGNKTNDPAFLGYQEGNYRFNRFSPCYNSGTNQTDWMNGAVDLDSHPRILHGRVDMGAYELFIPSGTMFTLK